MTIEKPVRIRCPHCSKMLSIPSTLRRKTITCPNSACKKSVTLPVQATPTESVGPAPQPAMTKSPAPHVETEAGRPHRFSRRHQLIVGGVAGGVVLLCGVAVLLVCGVTVLLKSRKPSPEAVIGELQGVLDSAKPGSPDIQVKPGKAQPDIVKTGEPKVAEGKPETKPDQAAEPALPFAFSSDLDEMVHMHSLGVWVQDKLLIRRNVANLTKSLERLRSSADPAVVAAVTASTPVAMQEASLALKRAQIERKLKADIRVIEDKLKVDNQAIYSKSKGSLLSLLSAEFSGPSDSAIDAALKRGDLDFQSAAQLRQERARAEHQAAMDIAGPASLAWANSYKANQQIVTLTGLANAQLAPLRGNGVLNAGIVVEKLAAALRARSGAKVVQSPLGVKLGMWYFPLVSVVSRADRELTRLTLLIEVETKKGPRFICAYVPKLGAGEPFRIEPAPAFPGEIGTKLIYSVWCDQFQIENVEFTETGANDALLAYGIHLAHPGAAYVTPQPLKSFSSGYSRYGLTFTKLTPGPNGYVVEAQGTRYDQNNPLRVVSTEKYTGTVRGDAEKLTMNITLLANADVPAKKILDKAGAKPRPADNKMELTLFVGNGDFRALHHASGMRVYGQTVAFIPAKEEVRDIEADKKVMEGLRIRAISLLAMAQPGTTYKGTWEVLATGRSGSDSANIQNAIHAKHRMKFKDAQRHPDGQILLRIDSCNSDTLEVTATLIDPDRANVTRQLKGEIKERGTQMILYFPGAPAQGKFASNQLPKEYLDLFTAPGDLWFQVDAKRLSGAQAGPLYPDCFMFSLTCTAAPEKKI